MVRNDPGAFSGGGHNNGGGVGAASLFRFEKRHYRVLETLALPGAEDAPVRQAHGFFLEPRQVAALLCLIRVAPRGVTPVFHLSCFCPPSRGVFSFVFAPGRGVLLLPLDSTSLDRRAICAATRRGIPFAAVALTPRPLMEF